MIEVHDVTKTFGPTTALDQVSFTVDRNEILGFLGPNGAGKSTAMKIITTYLAPDHGTVTVGGVDIADDPLSVRRRIGYLPEVAPLYDDMRVLTYLEFVARARGLEGKELASRLDWVYEATRIQEVLYKDVNELSRGFRQRVGLAQALIHDPDILILDEPTAGLDPRQIIGIRHLIRDLAVSKTVIFSSHILAEISAVTSRIVIIHEGKIVADGQADELRDKARKANHYLVGFAHADPEIEASLRGIAGVLSVEAAENGAPGKTWRVTTPLDRDVRRDVNELARSRGWDLLELHFERPTLEEAFIALTGREANR